MLSATDANALRRTLSVTTAIVTRSDTQTAELGTFEALILVFPAHFPRCFTPVPVASRRNDATFDRLVQL